MPEPETPTLTMDGKEYNLEDLSQEARAQVVNVRACDQHLQQLQQQLAIAQTARRAYVAALKSLLPETAPELDAQVTVSDEDSAAADV
jgi:Lon protease-like protein